MQDIKKSFENVNSIIKIYWISTATLWYSTTIITLLLGLSNLSTKISCESITSSNISNSKLHHAGLNQGASSTQLLLTTHYDPESALKLVAASRPGQTTVQTITPPSSPESSSHHLHHNHHRHYHSHTNHRVINNNPSRCLIMTNCFQFLDARRSQRYL